MSGGLPGLLRTGILEPILALAFPPLCSACGTFLPGPRSLLCPSCESALKAAILSEGERRDIRASLVGSSALDDVVVLARFDRGSPLRPLIHRLKYAGGRSVGEDLGFRLGGLLAAERLPVDALLPVPLHRSRRRERGYNQARLIADGIRSAFPLEMLDDVLRRSRSTPSQTGLTAGERPRNVAGAFLVPTGRESQIRGRGLLLVDDVLTTGATLNACASALKAAGARWCGAAALGRA